MQISFLRKGKNYISIEKKKKIENCKELNLKCGQFT